MTVSKGEIWLIDLNPIKKNNEMGKVRPALIYQNNELNKNNYPTTIIIPLSTHIIDDAEPIRFRINQRNNLKKDSDLVITQIRAIDNARFIEKLADLTIDEIEKVKELLNEITN